MVERIAIYIEGGGPTNATGNRFRRGMSTFLQPIVAEVNRRRIQWRLVICGGRQETYDKFCDALVREPEVLNVLLVDSEDPVATTVPPWEHLRNRKGDMWNKPARADDARCQMMVACMEAWFLADPDALVRHYGGNFDRSKLPAAHLAETRTKTDITNALKQATRNTKAKEYQKIRDGAKLLGQLNSTEVRKHCKWCERLFRTLGDAMGATV